jgi:DNA-binding transcriptional LysR family regulator
MAAERRPRPPLAMVRSFECAARHLSFTRAAQELGLTQAAVSAHVRALEAYLGRALFHRRARSLRLTETGAAYLPTLRQGLSQIDSATEAVRAAASERSVALAVPISLAQTWAPRRLAGFRERHPDIDVVLHGTVWEEAGPPAADIVISILRDDEAPPGAERLWRERLALLCAPEMAAQIAGPEDVRAAPKLFLLGRQEFWQRMADALGLEGVDLERGPKTNSSNIALEMAACGQGLTVSLASLAEAYLRRGLLAEPLAVRPDSPWSYYVRPASGQRRPAAARLLAWLRDGGG